jgi:protein-S-isoprenylcysteine O-methyltransferase Ste14
MPSTRQALPRTPRRKKRPTSGGVYPRRDELGGSSAVVVAPPRSAVVPNLGLALMLLTIVGAWFCLGPRDPAYDLGHTLLALSTAGLAAMALCRPPARNRDQRWWVYGLCFLSIFYVNGYRFDPGQGYFAAMVWGRVVIQLLANAALFSLGRSYAMLPALRDVRTGFLYGYVRHPVYAMYMLADLSALTLQPSLWNMGVAAVGATVFLLRAHLEEKVLCQDPIYSEYAQRVRWRFLPGVY